MNLYEINKRLNQILDIDFFIDEETGEVFGVEDLDNLELEFNEKMNGCIAYYKDIDGDIEKFKKEKERISKQIESLKNKKESLKKYIATNCPEGFKGDTGVLSYRKSSSVEVNEELEQEWMREKVSYEPDKKRIKEAIESGVQVKGAWVEVKSNPNIK